MEIGALAPYERALRDAAPLRLADRDGAVLDLDVHRWLAPADGADASVLERCRGPVLDVGCGPGRFVTALTGRGVPALGVDIADTAVALTRERGRPALVRDVFAALPGEGRWPTVLVMDGNVGIGGDPARLLARLLAAVAPAGRLLVEVEPEPTVDERLRVRFVDGDRPAGPEFAWARVGEDALHRHARAAGGRVAETWTAHGRCFAAVTRS